MPSPVLATGSREAESLAERLLSSDRALPVVVVTQAAGQDAPYIDAEAVADAVGDLATVYLMPTGPATWAFTTAMPEMTPVYGGAGRVYPVDGRWQTNPYLARPLVRLVLGAGFASLQQRVERLPDRRRRLRRAGDRPVEPGSRTR